MIGIWLPYGKTHLVERLPLLSDLQPCGQVHVTREDYSVRSKIFINGHLATYGGLSTLRYSTEAGWAHIWGTIDWPPVCLHCLKHHERRMQWELDALELMRKSVA